jgi:hypothetical protein
MARMLRRNMGQRLLLEHADKRGDLGEACRSRPSRSDRCPTSSTECCAAQRRGPRSAEAGSGQSRAFAVAAGTEEQGGPESDAQGYSRHQQAGQGAAN